MLSRYALLSAALSLSTTACTVGEDDWVPEGDLETSEATNKQQIQYIVMAHPDDEVGSWAMVQRSSGNYPVFILLTRGEGTGYCETPEAGYEPSLADGSASGEVAPSPMPTGRHTLSCAQARVNSWHNFLDAQADFDSYLERRSEMVSHGRKAALVAAGDAVPVRHDGDRAFMTDYFDLWVGERSARLVFNLGDGDLEPEEAVWAVRTARRIRGSYFPLTNEYGVIGASFYNSSYPDCAIYDHRDHRAVHVALWNTDLGVKAQWGRTCASDPDAERTDTIDEDIFQTTFGVEADGYRSGTFQQHYGWLLTGSWPYAERDHHGFGNITRIQSHWRRSWR